jgi:hypothetical protein
MAAERVDLDAITPADPHDDHIWVRAEDAAAAVAELRELRGRYGKGGEVWCGARRDQAGTAYCVEMAGHEQHGYPHMWSAPRQLLDRTAGRTRTPDRSEAGGR